jgi:Tat protein secretion system quality control protein TatD with DNase activity
MFIDAHCHLEMESFDKDRDEVIARSLAEGLTYMLTVRKSAILTRSLSSLIDTLSFTGP